MTLEKLILLSEKYDVRVDTHKNYQTSIPYYYDSLRHAFGFYCNTFITNNSAYTFYAEGLHKRNISVLKHQFLDEDNTQQTIIAFERFFELFIKSLLSTTHSNLSLILCNSENNKRVSIDRLKNSAVSLTDGIITGFYRPQKKNNKVLSIPFNEAINRFYCLADAYKVNPGANRIIKKFGKIMKEYPFLFCDGCKNTFKYLNWYRDRILHNGNKLPSLWLLDYTLSQRVLPVVKDIINIDQAKYKTEFFYFKTITGIAVLDKICSVKFEFTDLYKKTKQNFAFASLLKLGHLKELGRANMNMNLFVRANKATYEYNYHDPLGRGERFANAEKKHPDFRGISHCPCCGIKSLVLYNITVDDFFNENKKQLVSWVKCYTCDYHLRYDTGEPALLGIYPAQLFS